MRAPHSVAARQATAGPRAAASLAAWRPFTTRQKSCYIQNRRRQGVSCRSHEAYKELLADLRALTDAELAQWAAANRERLSLPFLGWLSDEELGSAEEGQQQALWELGSKLMALREGLDPVGNEVLQEELRAAALRCSGGSGSSSSEEDAAQQQDVQQQQRQQEQEQQEPAALAAPAFSSAVQAVAQLGLSPEGMALFQQQAAALEAVVGTSRAKSLTEVIGRARVQDEQQMSRLAEADAAVRILDVLLSVHDRDERAAMLPDAFTPPPSSAAVDDDASYFAPDEDQLYTTPLRLLQAIDLYTARLQGGGPAGGGAARPLPELVGPSLGLSLAQMQAALRELREDVEAWWAQGSDSDGC